MVRLDCLNLINKITASLGKGSIFCHLISDPDSPKKREKRRSKPANSALILYLRKYFKRVTKHDNLINNFIEIKRIKKLTSIWLGGAVSKSLLSSFCNEVKASSLVNALNSLISIWLGVLWCFYCHKQIEKKWIKSKRVIKKSSTKYERAINVLM